MTSYPATALKRNIESSPLYNPDLAPVPVFARAAYGTLGSNIPALMRALVACGWFGIQAWIGGAALHVFFRSLWPAWPHAIPGNLGGHTSTEWISFLLFWGLKILVVYRGMDLLRK